MHLKTMVIFVLVLILAPSPPVSAKTLPHAEGDYVPVDELTTLDPLFKSQFNLTVAFLGIEESRLNMTLMDSLLPKWYAPIDRIPVLFSGNMDYREEYIVNYQNIFLPSEDVQQFSTFIHSIAQKGPRPEFDAIVNNSLFDNFTDFDYVPMDPVENYLNSSFSFAQNTPTIFIIDTYTLFPDQFSPYFYNNSEFDLDVQDVPRPYGSNYMVAGGGHNSYTLWMDISAGPTDYRGQSWNHTSIYNGNVTALTTDVSTYVQTSLELRFLPSYIYTPVSPNRDVKFEYLLVDLANDGTDWTQVFKPDLLIDNYRSVNPSINWSYSFSSWNFREDRDFLSVLSSSVYTDSHSYDSWAILSYLDGIYRDLFNESTEDVTVIPNFLFAFPGDWMFDYLLGVAWSDESGDFSYVVSAANEKWIFPGYDVEFVDWYNSFGFPTEIRPGNAFYIESFDYEGAYPDIFQTNVSSSAPVQVDIVDSYNFRLFDAGENYTAVDSFVVDGDLVRNTTIDLLSRYYWIFQPASNSTVSIEIKIDTYRDRAFGFTFVAMHEGGHALGLSHPHDGWSWINEEEIFDWLWDLSYSQMTYAAHLSDVSYIDVQTLQRGMFGVSHNETVVLYNQLIDILRTENTFIPQSLYSEVSQIMGVIQDSETDFRLHAENKSYDALVIQVLEQMSDAYEMLNNILDERPWRISVSFEILFDNVELTFDVSIGGRQLLVNGSYESLLSLFTDVSHTSFSITVYLGSETVDIITGNTWELEGKTFDYRGLSTDTVSTSSDTSSVSTSKSSEETALPVQLTYLPVAMMIMVYRKRNR